MTRLPGRPRRMWATGLALALVASCSSPAGSPPPHTPDAPAATASATTRRPTAPASELQAFYEQKLAWTPCGAGQCATLTVPLDYARPAGRALHLPVKRRPATASKTGTLVVNPGGPGASGTQFVDAFERTGLESLDLVGWDVRGAGGDAALTCLDDRATDAYLALDTSPSTPEEVDALRAGAASFGQACAAHDRDLLAHVSTQESARDLDILRAALGESQLTFYGASYGTLLGALYAELFPDKAGRLVLDSASDVTGRPQAPQVSGFEKALDGFAIWCARQKCGWGATSEAVKQVLIQFTQNVETRPIMVGKRQLTQSHVAYGVAGLLYRGEAGWPYLRDALTAAKAGDGTALLAASDAVAGRRPDGTYAASFAASQAIVCADQPRSSASEVEARWQRDRSLAPYFGTYFGPDLGCSSWPTAPAPWTTPHGRGGAPVVVIGATGDPASPYAWAQTMAKTLTSGRLLTYDGFGHVSYGGKSACIDAAVRSYLTTGAAPAEGTVCR